MVHPVTESAPSVLERLSQSRRSRAPSLSLWTWPKAVRQILLAATVAQLTASLRLDSNLLIWDIISKVEALIADSHEPATAAAEGAVWTG